MTNSAFDKTLPADVGRSLQAAEIWLAYAVLILAFGCAPRPAAPQGSTSACSAETRCVDGMTCNDPDYVPPPSGTPPVPSSPSCARDDQCTYAPGSACDEARHVCSPKCDAEHACKRGFDCSGSSTSAPETHVCVRRACAHSVECADAVCVNGHCFDHAGTCDAPQGNNCITTKDGSISCPG